MQGTQYPNATYILMQFSFFSLLKLHNLVLSLKKKNPVQCYSNWNSWVSLNESMSILCSLQPKTLRLSWKDRSFFEKLQSFSLLSSISFFSPNFHKELISSLSLSREAKIFHQICPISLCNKWTSPRFGRVRY